MPKILIGILIFGLLTGNSNIIKVSSKNYEQVKIICKLIKELLKKKYSDYKSYLKIINLKTRNDEYIKKRCCIVS